ncbi:MAG: hypothetical protein EOP56_10325 [Sphingobacteriales bacterium]|nr:MAG: hypothetical protein EOP56_10325 [Sphingobacteriales bacterium]
MPAWKNYNKLEISGSMLVPGFSIYLMEVQRGDELPYYYVGMTGDPHYPSARAAFHRIAGHLELREASTQNQLHKAMRDKMNVTDEDIANLRITMHHFPVDGFEKYQGDLGTINKTCDAYTSYKAKQQKVSRLEDTIIYRLKQKLGARALNKTEGADYDLNGYQQILDDVLKIVK